MLGIITGIASVIGTIASTVATIGLTLQGLKILCGAIVSIGKSLGLIKTEKPEDLGDKALQAEEEGIVPENYDTYQQYVDAVEEFEIDPEKSAHYTEEAKLTKATELSCGVLSEKTGEAPEVYSDFFKTAGEFSDYFAPDKNDPGRISEIIKSGSDTMKLTTGYFSGKETDPDNMEKAVNAMAAIDHKLYPDRSDTEIRSEILKASIKDM